MPSKTELFLDDELIEWTASVTRKIHRVRKHRLNPVLRPEHWWEGNSVIPLASLYDQEEKLFKMWYRTGPLNKPQEFIDGHASYTAYATSTDGVHWEKPLLGALELAGRRDHNIVMISEGLDPRYLSEGKKLFIRSVIRHPHPRDENEKYVCLLFDMKDVGIYLGYSADGIHWRREQQPFWQTLTDVASKHWGDDSIVSMIYDSFKRRWVIYRRVNPQESGRLVAQPGDENWPRPDRAMRVISYADSADLKHWENHRIIMIPDADDPADVEFYGLSCYNYAQVYVGYLWVYHMAPEKQTIDSQLTTSRDGIHFTRCCRREVFIPNGPADYYDHMIMVGHQPEPIILNDQVYIFYEAFNEDHGGSWGPHSCFSGALCTFTRDRFVSLETGVPPPCRVVTKPFVIEHPKLFLNAATWGDGAVQVEILQRDWRVIEGFTAQEADIIKGNALNHPVRWKGNGDLGRLVGKEVRLKFNMSDARLHAIYFDTEERPLNELPPLKATGSGYADTIRATPVNP